MKKIAALLLALVMLVTLAACGEKAPQKPEDVTGETYETSLLTALVPDGWMAFVKSDVFQDYPDEDGDPTGVRIYKDAKSEWDMFSKPGVLIDYYPNSDTSLEYLKAWYDNAEDIDAITVGKYTWEGFKGESAEEPTLVLLTETDAGQIQVTMTLESSGGKIALEDADVQAIITSITIK